MKKNSYIITFIFFIIFVIEGMFLLNSFTVTEGNSDVLYSYKANPTGTYSVNLKPNDYTDSTTLGMNQMYISKLVSSINTKFNYEFSGSTAADLNYTYSVTADIIGNYQSTNEDNNKEIWKKSYVLVPATNVNLNGKTSFTLDKDVPIEFEQYNLIVQNFYKEISVPMDAYLLVKYNVNVSGTPSSNVGKINEESSFEIKIPLNEQAFQITTNSNTSENKTISKVTEATKSINFGMLVVSLAAIAITSLIFFAYKKKFAPEKESAYEKEIKRILKEYGDIIVEINTLMDISKMAIIEVKSIRELIDLESELRIPILYYEEENESWFMIIQGRQLYRFIIKEEQEN